MTSAHEDRVHLLTENELGLPATTLADERALVVSGDAPSSLSQDELKPILIQGIPGRPNISRQSNSSAKPQLLRIACIGLHAVLVALYSVLLWVRIKRLEHHIHIQEALKEVWSTGFTMLTQAFVVLYSAVLLVLTQQLYIRRNLLVRQTLTATHDISSSWDGLGSALMSLWRQLFVPASVTNVACIAVYLACLQAVHISTPAMIKVEPFNYTIYGDAITTSALPSAPGPQTDYGYAWYTAAPILPLIKNFSQISTVGLSGSTIYDVLQPDQRGTGNVTVNSTTFDVSCHRLSNVMSRQWNYGSDYGWNITADPVASLPSDYKVNFWVPIVAYSIFQAAFHSTEWETTYLANTVLYYSSLNITDSQGTNSSRVTLAPGSIPVPRGTIDSLLVMGCHFHSSNRNDTIADAASRTILNPPAQKTESTWSDPHDTANLSSSLDTLQYWNWITYQIAVWMPSGLTDRVAYCNFISCEGVERLTTLDQYIADQLGILPGGPRPAAVQLYQVENALSNMAAALHWALTQMKPPEKNWQVANRLQSVPANTTMQYPRKGSILHSHMGPILTGLTASVVLLILAVLLVANLEGKIDGVDSTGVLQVIWLLRDRPDLRNVISQVDTPSVDSLRRAGMVPVRLAEDAASEEQTYHPVGSEFYKEERI